MNPFRAWQSLTNSEQTQIIWTVIIVLLAMVALLTAVAASRGQDVEYFKQRLGLMEQRVNYMDQRIDRTSQTLAEHRDHIQELRRLQEAQLRQLEEQQRWIDHWKTLPQLPRPQNRR